MMRKERASHLGIEWDILTWANQRDDARDSNKSNFDPE
jgi:hypothetical protein